MTSKWSQLWTLITTNKDPISSTSTSTNSMLPPSSSLTQSSLRRIIKSLSLLTFFSILLYALYIHFQPSIIPQTPDIPEPVPPPSPEDSYKSIYGYPPTNPTIPPLHIHDPSILYDLSTNTYYAYGSGPHIPIHTAPTLQGPWTKAGTVLDADSILPKGDRKAPWAPTALLHDGTFYVFYATSHSGCRDSAIGVATSTTPGPGGWEDHGAIAISGRGERGKEFPFDRANAIDVSVVVDYTDTDTTHNPTSSSEGEKGGKKGKGYMTFGSFWTGIWQVPLKPNLLHMDKSGEEEAADEETRVKHLAHEPMAIHPPTKKADGLCGDTTGMHPVEGAFISYHDPWWYLWFSWGKCCHFDPEKLPKAGLEYSIRVGRSSSPQGPFVDKSGKDLVDGGGEIVYGSNGDVYAPGGQGVLSDEVEGDVLYYHYLNKSVGYEFKY
ncbi:hypothetical protein AbraCBS73388_010002 [Aspergillus brasiliensis]|uniref:Arabinan endo-1,5-alpha-L-arabinosidase n=1 Tax=Aspergillus brasiliensis TaxID=319629 RepID=A0A9W5YHN5_9EURO|nr:hypothetical protein AbraCBS73388_010002 [Aspergillus brasiliensis]